ncbi:phosphoribosylformylglycinamidine synthase subunit PurS [Vagococcus vulneris]|uniref:Phosphoribosylformylglycinamidine synthase subunit PurS n=1 Tax=Vagococcus vulneris TaxID=1977869 RepID=A0A429ZXH6_9ENTE|nr:phosphoribosylformylglycinamidine synthase subunit PurS [Vagococcus vulneris]RST98421.1 phosphoribosylformylglycinamidine synthase, purS protein [Vagococcus vulneris]
MFNIRVYVSYKESVLDPQAEVIEKAMNRLNQGEISQVKIGKFFDFYVKAETKEEAIKAAKAISDQLLANVNMESYYVELLEDN